MEEYYVNKNIQPNGDHEIHTKSCFYLPIEENRIQLGYFSNCKLAVRRAKDFYSSIDGCAICSNDCHKICCEDYNYLPHEGSGSNF